MKDGEVDRNARETISLQRSKLSSKYRKSISHLNDRDVQTLGNASSSSLIVVIN